MPSERENRSKKRVFIYNISKYATKEMIELYFTKFGEISNFSMMKNKNDSAFKYGFISYGYEKEVDECIETVNRERPFNMRADFAKLWSDTFGDRSMQGCCSHSEFSNFMPCSKDTLSESGDEDYSGICLFCYKKAYMVCNCHKWYCSRKCQKQHWPIHYSNCEPILQIPTRKMLQSYAISSTKKSDVRKSVSMRALPTESDTIHSFAEKSAVHEGSTKVKLVHYINPSCFYVQYQKDEKDIEAIATKLKAMSIKSDIFLPMKGELCAALFDDKWYRAMVLNFDLKEPRLHFIDTGEEKRIMLNDICKLPSELKRYPRMAHCCTLYGVSPLEGQWLETDINDFSRLIIDEEFTISIKKIEGDKLAVQLVDSDGNDLGDLLVDLRIAQTMQPGSANGPQVELCIPKLKLGDQIELKCTKSEKNFFCAQIVQNEKEYDKFIKMEDEFNTTELDLVKTVNSGDFVLAFSPSFDKWLRAKVLETLSDVESLVFYVDYGNTEVVEKVATLANIWCMPSNLLCLTCTNKTSFECPVNDRLDAIVTLVQSSSIRLVLVDEECSVLLKGQPMSGPVKNMLINS